MLKLTDLLAAYMDSFL